MRCLVADDHELIREGVKLLLESTYPGINIFEASSGKEVRNEILNHKDLDFILLDYFLPGTDTMILIREISENHPEIPLIIFSGVENTVLMKKFLYLGASGFIPKSSDNETVLYAIEQVLSGEIYKPKSMLQFIDSDAPNDEGVVFNSKNKLILTERQLEVLKLVSLGKTNKEIATLLQLSKNTIKVHITAISQVLQTNSRTEAVIVAHEKGLL